MASSWRAGGLCRRHAAAAAAARSVETSTLNFGCPEFARGLERDRPARGNRARVECSRAWSVPPGSAPDPSLRPRCQSHHCLNAVRGAAAEVVAQVETGHGEPGGKTQSSGRGPSLARQLGCWHAHAGMAAMDCSEDSSHARARQRAPFSWNALDVERELERRAFCVSIPTLREAGPGPGPRGGEECTVRIYGSGGGSSLSF